MIIYCTWLSVCRCDMASCLDARPSTQRPDFPQWLTSSSCFEPSALMVHRSHSADLRMDTSFTVTVQSGWFERPPRQGDITRLEIRAVTLQTEIHLDLKCLNAPEVQEFIHPSMLSTMRFPLLDFYTVWLKWWSTAQGHHLVISAIIYFYCILFVLFLVFPYDSLSLHIICFSSVVNSLPLQRKNNNRDRKK